MSVVRRRGPNVEKPRSWSDKSKQQKQRRLPTSTFASENTRYSVLMKWEAETNQVYFAHAVWIQTRATTWLRVSEHFPTLHKPRSETRHTLQHFGLRQWKCGLNIARLSMAFQACESWIYYDSKVGDERIWNQEEDERSGEIEGNHCLGSM